MMYNHVEDSGKGDPMFYELTEDEIKLHDEKNQDYRSTSNPVANFDRVAAWMALYPDMNWARPEMVAILYAQKQIDSAMSLMERGIEGGVETIDTRARDVHIYWKLFRVIRRKHKDDKHVEVQSRAGPIRMESEPDVAAQWDYAIRQMQEARPVGYCEPTQPSPDYSEWIPPQISKPRTLWQRFLRRIGL